jgi:hypothetical protein
MYKLHNQCLDCVVKKETQLKLEGKYDEYESNIMKNNIKYALDDYVNGLDDFLDEITSKNEYVTEQGDIEDWESKKVDKTTLKEKIINDIEQIKQQLSI